MILRYCDACGQQIEKSYASDRLKAELKKRQNGKVTTINVEVVAGINSPNMGDVCRDCVIDAVMTADTRPKYAEPEPVG